MIEICLLTEINLIGDPIRGQNIGLKGSVIFVTITFVGIKSLKPEDKTNLSVLEFRKTKTKYMRETTRITDGSGLDFREIC